MEQWYALYTKPNSEYQVAGILRQRGIETFLPDMERQKANKMHTRNPFFPCYLFIKVDFKTVSASQWLWTPGLRSIVTYGDRPVAVPDEVINLIRRKLNEFETSRNQPECRFKPGETVRITNGPFRDMLAVFDKPVTPGERVQILLRILGHASRVRIDMSDIEKSPSAASEHLNKRPRRTRGRGRHIRNCVEN